MSLFERTHYCRLSIRLRVFYELIETQNQLFAATPTVYFQRIAPQSFVQFGLFCLNRDKNNCKRKVSISSNEIGSFDCTGRIRWMQFPSQCPANRFHQQPQPRCRYGVKWVAGIYKYTLCQQKQRRIRSSPYVRKSGSSVIKITRLHRFYVVCTFVYASSWVVFVYLSFALYNRTMTTNARNNRDARDERRDDDGMLCL